MNQIFADTRKNFCGVNDNASGKYLYNFFLQFKQSVYEILRCFFKDKKFKTDSVP